MLKPALVVPSSLVSKISTLGLNVLRMLTSVGGICVLKLAWVVIVLIVALVFTWLVFELMVLLLTGMTNLHNWIFVATPSRIVLRLLNKRNIAAIAA